MAALERKLFFKLIWEASECIIFYQRRVFSTSESEDSLATRHSRVCSSFGVVVLFRVFRVLGFLAFREIVFFYCFRDLSSELNLGPIATRNSRLGSFFIFVPSSVLLRSPSSEFSGLGFFRVTFYSCSKSLLFSVFFQS